MLVEPLEMLEEPPTLEELASCIQLPEEVPDYSEQYPSVNISEDEMVYYNTIFQGNFPRVPKIGA